MMRTAKWLIAILAVASVVAAPAAWGTRAQDLRSPDARDAASAPEVSQDLRSPDARDAAAGRTTAGSPVVDIVRIPARSEGFDWGDAAIGGAVVGGVVLVGLGSLGAATRRRRGPSRVAVG